ncbi:MAG: type II toxin-antitoxin system VapC family toxin [Deltaproteobacteria bacterium]|nr:type II toxin-antitoxin system VapC family toxin [Deltaproteobacteria bacterium]
MSRNFVADASVSVAWVHPAQATQQTEDLLEAVYAGAELHVPALWSLEVANALVVLVRRHKLTEAERTQALAALRQFSVKVDQDGASLAFTKLSTLATEHGLGVYDAAYLELAVRKKLPLACKDGPLRAAAKRCRVKLA